jgi:hypothetical protein
MSTKFYSNKRFTAPLLASIILIGVLSGCAANSAAAPPPATTAPPAQFTRHGSWECVTPEGILPSGKAFFLALALDDDNGVVGAITMHEGSSVGASFSVGGFWLPSGTFALTDVAAPSLGFYAVEGKSDIVGKLTGGDLTLFASSGLTPSSYDGNCHKL